MKETYEAAEMEIIEFETEDVITTSSEKAGGDKPYPGAKLSKVIVWRRRCKPPLFQNYRGD